MNKKWIGLIGKITMGICNSIRVAPYKFSIYEEVSMRERDLRQVLYEYNIYDWEEVMEMMMLSVIMDIRYGNTGMSSYIWREMRRKHRLGNLIWRNEYRELELMYGGLVGDFEVDMNLEEGIFERVNWMIGVRRRFLESLVYNFIEKIIKNERIF